jgi:Ser/Thr protein kinase RdoA (MazF antagonist)
VQASVKCPMLLSTARRWAPCLWRRRRRSGLPAFRAGATIPLMSIEGTLARYSLSLTAEARPLEGSAGATVRVQTDCGSYVLRRRGQRSSSPERVAFDGRLRRFLRAQGLPSVVAVPTSDGEPGVRLEDGFWELYPFVEGSPYRHGEPGQLAGLGHTTAFLHRAGAEFRLRGDVSPLLEQFSLAVPGAPGSRRIDDPVCMRKALSAAAGLLEDLPRSAAGRMEELLSRVAAHYGGARYSQLDRYVIHGDLHPSNVLFDGMGGVAGLFDTDWAVFSPRVRDLADALWFFAGESESQRADIWSLTSARRVDEELARLLLQGYCAELPVGQEEAQAVQWAWLGRWIAMHLEGMYKVPMADRVRFLTRDMEEPVEEVLSMDIVGLFP